MKTSHSPLPEYRIMTVEKAIETIELLSDAANDNHDLASIAEKLQLTRNKTFRILCTLVDLGIAEKDTSRGTYNLGITAFEFARKMMRQASLINNTHPVIEELAKKHQEAVYLTVLCNREVVFLDMADCEQQVRAVSLVGKRYPFFSTAAGKVMAAMGFSTDQIHTWLSKSRRNSTGDNMDQFQQELVKIRSDGVAVDENSLGEGVVSIAVPFKDYAGKVLGAITLLGPSFRLLSGRVEKEIIPSMREYAELLSCRFGYLPA